MATNPAQTEQIDDIDYNALDRMIEEEFDNDKDLNNIVLPQSSRLFVKTYRNLFGGIPVITAKAQRRNTSGWDRTLYRPAGSSLFQDTVITAIPYFMWANREPGEMLVWIREV